MVCITMNSKHTERMVFKCSFFKKIFIIVYNCINREVYTPNTGKITTKNSTATTKKKKRKK